MPAEKDYIPYQTASLPTDARPMVLAPHPDDEVLGCGATMALHVAAGHTVHVLVLTDGCGLTKVAERDAYRRTRQDESRAAARVLGYPAPEFLGAPDRRLAQLPGMIEQLEQRVRAGRISHLYCPSPSEIHPDHFATAMFALDIAARVDGLQLVFYEVGAPLQPNFLVDVTAVWEQKQRAMACFKSQLALQSYDQHIAGLNSFRSYTLGRSVKKTEAFRRIDGTQLNDVIAIFGRSRFTDIVLSGPVDGGLSERPLRPVELLTGSK